MGKTTYLIGIIQFNINEHGLPLIDLALFKQIEKQTQ